jgi:methylenetetrahydrofolate dehydrogenase (NADP+) / methenyltetrahydrofolate cyclohydrolase
MTQLVDGRAIAAAIAGQTAAAAAGLRAAGTVPGLAVLLPTDDPGAAWYVGSIERAAARAGVSCQVHRLAGPASSAEISGRLAGLSADPAVHGIICQTPLPPGATLAAVGQAIDVAKDVDGANPASLGRLAAGLPGAFPPATAAAVLEILRHEDVALRGRRAVVVGRSVVVGKPAALLLLAGDATVTICHSRTRDLAAVCREAEVLVVAAGRIGLIGPDHVAPGAVVIDVGTNPAPGGGLAGDVDAAAVTGLAGLLTPVPGGVGPVTTAMLIRHTVLAAAGLAAAGQAAAR